MSLEFVPGVKSLSIGSRSVLRPPTATRIINQYPYLCVRTKDRLCTFDRGLTDWD
jgi:hypothetical protein